MSQHGAAPCELLGSWGAVFRAGTARNIVFDKSKQLIADETHDMCSFARNSCSDPMTFRAWRWGLGWSPLPTCDTISFGCSIAPSVPSCDSLRRVIPRAVYADRTVESGRGAASILPVPNRLSETEPGVAWTRPDDFPGFEVHRSQSTPWDWHMLQSWETSPNQKEMDATKPSPSHFLCQASHIGTTINWLLGFPGLTQLTPKTTPDR